MTLELTLTKIGNSTGAVFSRVALLNVKRGDKIYLTKAADGFRLTAGDPQFAKTMEIFEKGVRRYRNTLRELAK